MKMKKSLVALCLSVGLLACVPAVSFADVNFVPQNTSAAPAIPAAALQQRHGRRLINPKRSQPSSLWVASN